MRLPCGNKKEKTSHINCTIQEKKVPLPAEYKKD